VRQKTKPSATKTNRSARATPGSTRKPRQHAPPPNRNTKKSAPAPITAPSPPTKSPPDAPCAGLPTKTLTPERKKPAGGTHWAPVEECWRGGMTSRWSGHALADVEAGGRTMGRGASRRASSTGV
jgi:hypothetical protein